MLDCGGGSGVRARALPGFVGVNAALDAHADGRAESGGGAEGIADDEREQFRYAVDIDEDDDHRQHDVGERHERHDYLREIGDAADAAENDEGEQHQHAGGGDEAVRADRTGDAGFHRFAFAENLHHRAGNAVRLRANQKEAAGKRRGDGKEDAVPAPAEAALKIIGGAAEIHARVLVMHLVNLAEGGFHISGARAQQGADPHPEHRTGSAETNRRGDPGDVANADAARERYRQRLE